MNYSYIENPKAIELLEKLRKEERKLSRMREHETKAMKALGIHSRNYSRQRKKVASIYEKMTNIRKDFLHKLSRRMCNENKVIVVESLKVRSMLEGDNTTRLKRSIADASWGTFLNMLEYKAEETGCILMKAETNFPSTKLCSYCGYINKGVTLSMRSITCPNCRNTYDRDGNAARNLYTRRWLNAENSWAVGTIVH